MCVFFIVSIIIQFQKTIKRLLIYDLQVVVTSITTVLHLIIDDKSCKRTIKIENGLFDCFFISIPIKYKILTQTNDDNDD